jgi:hypothetical protein
MFKSMLSMALNRVLALQRDAQWGSSTPKNNIRALTFSYCTRKRVLCMEPTSIDPTSCCKD